jgi:pyruvate dehydrogenase E2 component (dihydrolipoamide acetyltransferase)
MPVEILMPKLGLTMQTGAIAEWHVREGQKVNRGDVIATIQTEKIAYDLESEVDGMMVQILVQPEEEVTVGTPIGLISPQ